MTGIFNFLAELILILMLVFVVLVLIFVMWYYGEILFFMIKERIDEYKRRN